ncbi:MAG: NADH:ubiquinone reductase (Na(+)-transporting) subunit B [Candidatus Omnitrophota bacterium]|nr:NADH:ubiquinone reductase (Na(+)-transporting) subunit B [Candidatus Omnitrophota bacterium]MDZ4241436.1 NADH:ubiquinone reductase (Na(+)-transporting) subunit B [Candidatus Omnitrophota bacterium]
MKFLEEHLKKAEHLFEKGKPLAKFYPLFEALDTFLLTPGKVTKRGPHVRDAADLKRVMVFVIIALVPATLMGMFNTGHQMLLAKGLAYDFWQCWILGAQKVLPIIIISYMAGGFWEVLFAVMRKHEINEGFLVTGLLFPLTLPPDMPLWQAAVGISFGVVFGKEIFGGTGMNVFNPALVARAFVFFAYPAQISGSNVWVAVDGFTRATPLAVAADAGRGQSAIDALQAAGYNFNNMLTGFIPGSIGETSALACLAGLIFLLITRVASWRTVAGCVLGLLAMASVFYFLKGPNQLSFFALPPHWHLVMGGFAFGAVFMATDPVSAPATQLGRWIYGFLIGVLTVLIRVVNPAYPEGVMLAILFMNIFAPLIDYFILQKHIQKRLKGVTWPVKAG